ncbi:MAG TPA: ComEC/Rec2 family competence protein [Victivallales bacterium]|nr:ComEC/Rec2 family competence protein [Victivallales bacterium]
MEYFFRHSGVGHVLAVSGLHVSVVSLLLFSLFRITRINPKYFAPFLVILLFLFAFLTGARPSSLRATIMNSLVIIFYVYGGGGLTQSAYTGLAFSSFLILLRRPMALYSPGFLLSFGAVFSLVTLTNPFDRLLRMLRGGKFFAGVIFFLLSIYLICIKWEFFLRVETIFALIALFWLLLYLGGKLNEVFPKITIVNPDKLPISIRLFFAAQIAIQFGMMIPLSSFFFGQFPVAGIFVNFLAIPLIGVIVQLGLLGGMLGVIPVVGKQLALMVGAANYVFAKFFIWIAYVGSEIFPFPVTPIPGLRWLIIYYLLLGIFASSGLWIRKVQSLSFLLYKKYPLIQSVPPVATLIVLISIPIYRYKILPDRRAELHLLANTSNTVICITNSDYRRGAILIGGGDVFFGQSSLKSFLLMKKNIYIEDAFLLGHSPDSGMSALAELSSNFRIDKVYCPNFYGLSGATMPSSSMKMYFKAIGEDRIYNSALEGKKWAINYYESFVRFANALSGKVEIFTPPASFNISDGIKIEYPLKVYRSYSLPIIIKFKNKKVLIIPDIGVINKIPKEELNVEIVVLAGPTKANYKYHLKSIRFLLDCVKPEIILYCVNPSFVEPVILETIEESSDILAKGTERFLRTDKCGTVTFVIDGDILSEKFKTYVQYGH